MSAIAFQSTTFDVVDRNNQPWLRSLQVASALGYKNPTADIQNLFNRHADEFTDSMTAVIKLPTAGGVQDTRIFSPRGCYALGMFARTKVAKDFRVWVLDVLEGKSAASVPALPVPVEMVTVPAHNLRALIQIARLTHQTVFKEGLYEALDKLGASHYAARLYSIAQDGKFAASLVEQAAIGKNGLTYAQKFVLQSTPSHTV